MTTKLAVVVAALLVLTALSTGTAFANFTAYNDCVYTSPQPAPLANVTTYTPAGADIPSGSIASGKLKDFATGAATGVTASLTQSGTTHYQPSLDTGGSETAVGTDAYNLFTAKGVGVGGVVYYGTNPWYVDLTFTGLDPTKRYEFVTTANRNGAITNTGYDNRFTKFTVSGADAFVNTSSAGTTISGASTIFNTGRNTTTGYVARWADIAAGADGTFKVRAEAYNPSVQNSTYAFSAFSLSEVPEPSCLMVLAAGIIPLVLRRPRK